MRRWRLAFMLAMAGMAQTRAAFGTDDETVQRLVSELQAMKQRLDKVEKLTAEQQQVIRQQSETIRQLSGTKRAATPAPIRVGTAPAAPASAPAPVEVAAAPPPAPSPAPWSPSQPIPLVSGSHAYLNLSFNSLVDFGWSTTPDVQSLERGDHDPIQRGFTLPNSEIVLDGAVDPYFRGVANLVFKLDENNDTDVELEEAYLVTTSLPWNLQAKAGQFLSEFGRVNLQHPHAWDFVDQPLVMGRIFGPEGLRNPGARLSWLVPTPFYSEFFAGVQDSQGASAYSFRNTEDDLFGRMPIDRSVQSLGDMLYVPRYVASFEPTDSQTIVAGLSGAFGPNASGSNTYTQIYGGDVYWKWKPAWQSGGFPFVSWQTEALGRRYQAGSGVVDPPATPLPHETLYDWGIYSQVLYGFTPRWVAGLRGDWVSGDHGQVAADDLQDRLRVSPNITFYPTEFSKIRLQYNYDHRQYQGDDSSVWMQVEFLLGAHAAHKF